MEERESSRGHFLTSRAVDIERLRVLSRKTPWQRTKTGVAVLSTPVTRQLHGVVVVSQVPRAAD